MIITLDQLQRSAESAARKLGVTEPIKVVWSRDCPTNSLTTRSNAHCHTEPEWRGVICVSDHWDLYTRDDARRLMEHEVTHLTPEGKRGHGIGFHRSLARLQPDSHEARKLKRQGVLAHSHRWRAARIRPGSGQPKPPDVIIMERCSGCGDERPALYTRTDPS